MAPKIPYVPDDIAGPIPDAIRKRRGGELLELDRMLLHNPAIAEGWNHFFGAIRTKTSLSDQEREVAICWVAVLNEAEYEWQQHAPLAMKAGMTEAHLEELHAGTYSDLEEGLKTIIELTTAMTRNVQIEQGLFEKARGELGEEKLHDLIATVAGYNLVSRYLVALGVGQ